jgi:hypothetical protein
MKMSPVIKHVTGREGVTYCEVNDVENSITSSASSAGQILQRYPNAAASASSMFALV